MYKQHFRAEWVRLKEQSLMFDESLSYLIVPALGAKDGIAYVPAEPSHLF